MYIIKNNYNINCVCFQAQGVAWFGMAITGIMAHFCAIPFTGIEANLGSLFRITLHNMYFRSGSCEPDDLPLTDIDSLEGLNLKSPTHVFIWMWVYMLISLLWIVSSITMITSKQKKQDGLRILQFLIF